MSLSRTSNVLRTSMRPLAAHPMRSGASMLQTRTKIRGPDDLGGPGGQEPAPQKPAGRDDAMKRNWPAMAGGALAILGLYAYTTSGSPKQDLERADQNAVRLKAQGEQNLNEARAKGEQKWEEMKRKGEKGWEDAKARADELRRQGEREWQDMKARGEKGWEDVKARVENDESKGLGEFSGRKGGMGGFRSD